MDWTPLAATVLGALVGVGSTRTGAGRTGGVPGQERRLRHAEAVWAARAAMRRDLGTPA
ncbi:hypothetical protein [Streptomyces sp. NBRC 14336]|uniref:hypothetical protein n=1 Tax=Streptomyces sp. NBRC 14336 TaxID=3030992 RepID=UPI00255745A8|nr:hypothetical protein [Streptomyces sp. NBRC 14336]